MNQSCNSRKPCGARRGDWGRAPTWKAGLAIVLIVLSGRIVAPADAQPPFEALNKGQQALQAGRRLEAIEQMRAAAEQHPQLESLLLQFLPVISDYTPTHPLAAVEPSEVQHRERFEQVQAAGDAIQRKNAIEAIRALARDRRIVILNEAHDCPQHRAFGHQLAEALHADGFQWLGIETLLGPLGKAGRVRVDYPTLATGSYTAEPVFGDFVRRAARLGYRLVAYEIEPWKRSADPRDVHASILERETAQAENLIRHVFDRDPEARLFLYVGYSHATENWEPSERGELGWLAAQLHRKTGIDPLTIDQVGGSYHPKSGTVDPVFAWLQKQQAIDEPILAQLPDGSWLVSDGYFGKTDLTVFLPPQTMQQGRPDWLRMNGYRQPVPIANADFYRSTTTLVQAFFSEEPEIAIPVDQVLLSSDQGDSTLLLPVGKYRLQVQTAEGELEPAGELEVGR